MLELVEFFDYEAGVLSAESETVGESNIDFSFSRFVRNVIEIALRIGFDLVDSRVKDAVVDALDACNCFERAGSSEGVTNH